MVREAWQERYPPGREENTVIDGIVDAPKSLEVSQADTGRFGILVARVPDLKAEQVAASVDWCEERAVALLISRCSAAEPRAAHAMQRHGFLLMDCLATYEHPLTELPSSPPDAGFAIRSAVAADADAVENLARRSFGTHRGHYHADPRLDRSACDEVYASWARDAVIDDTPSTLTVVAAVHDEVIGFATLTGAGNEVAVGGVAAVTPSHRGKGVYRSMMVERLRLARRSGSKRTVVSAHVANIAPQRCWTDLGYRIVGSTYTFHRWADALSPSIGETGSSVDEL